MAKKAAAGERRVLIRIEGPIENQTSNGYTNPEYSDLFPGEMIWAKWVSAHGKDVLESDALSQTEKGTVTIPFSALITPTCRVYRGDDTNPFSIISINDVLNVNRTMEIYVERQVKAI